MEIKIKPRGEQTPEPKEMPPPGIRGGTEIRSIGDPLPDPRVYVREEVLAAMVARAKDGGDYEVGGFLLGGLHHYDGRRYVDITTQVPALKAESARAHLTFSNDAQRAFHETLDREHPGALVLGWYHTHPGYGVFLSGYDQFIHRSFYARDYHVAIVIDPHSDEVGVFVWEQGEISQPYALVVYGGA
jgi:proteasome lid subunit RPN8/RPN11